ncbi:MAG: phosphatase PAP2 family protein [Microbacterium sp.]
MSAPVDDRETTIALQRLAIGALLVASTAALGILVTANAQIGVDDWWNGFVRAFAGFQSVALALNFLGGGWFATFVVPLGGCAVLLMLRRPWGAAFVVLASAASAGGVQALKAIFGRARPEDIIVASDYGSFPSGHTANAATLAIVAVVLLPRVGVAIVGATWVLAMAFSRTQVHAHWLSDTVGGMLAGAGIALVAASVLTTRLDAEQRARVARLAA